MKTFRLLVIPSLVLFFSSLLPAQDLSTQVMQVLEAKCASCHSHASPQSGLDLEGTGSTAFAKSNSVVQQLVEVSPANNFAKAQGYQYIYPGRPDKSFLFRKVNNGFDTDISLSANEGSHMPKNGTPLTDYEKELLRQWILFGAPSRDSEVDAPGFDQVVDNLTDYYLNNNGLDSYPEGPPPAPEASEGFQVKMGPFFIEPGGELELFQKYELDLPEAVEVARVDMNLAGYSHHLVVYNYNLNSESRTVPGGYRDEGEHLLTNLVAAVQEPTDLHLPQGTAFFWPKDVVLDLNSHYINYSVNQTYKAEAYINVYTQPNGTASQQMFASLIPNTSIQIPNDGNTTTIAEPFTFGNLDIYAWGVMGHTHQYGTGYKIFLREENGSRGELMYDASCPRGIPGCPSPYFDYRHIPMRYFEDGLYPVDLEQGIIHEATWLNDGPAPVRWGDTSKDEMMVMIVMYVTDTTGVLVSNESPPVTELPPTLFPNPMQERATVVLPPSAAAADFTLFDLLGRPVRRLRGIRETQFQIERGDLPRGIYLYSLETTTGKIHTGKLVIE